MHLPSRTVFEVEQEANDTSQRRRDHQTGRRRSGGDEGEQTFPHVITLLLGKRLVGEDVTRYLVRKAMVQLVLFGGRSLVLSSIRVEIPDTGELVAILKMPSIVSLFQRTQIDRLAVSYQKRLYVSHYSPDETLDPVRWLELGARRPTP